jgi:hypothetical protein
MKNQQMPLPLEQDFSDFEQPLLCLTVLNFALLVFVGFVESLRLSAEDFSCL